MDASDDRSVPRDASVMPPEVDPDEAVDPPDPDSAESDPAAWPGWTDRHRYTFDRGGAR